MQQKCESYHIVYHLYYLLERWYKNVVYLALLLIQLPMTCCRIIRVTGHKKFTDISFYASPTQHLKTLSYTRKPRSLMAGATVINLNNLPPQQPNNLPDAQVYLYTLYIRTHIKHACNNICKTNNSQTQIYNCRKSTLNI